MRLLPHSLRGRLLAIAAATTLMALVVAGFGIAHVLERYVTGTIDARLDDRLAAFSAAVTRDGRIDAGLADRLDTIVARDGDWRIDAPRGTAGSTVMNGMPGISFADGQQLPPLSTLTTGRHHRRRAVPSDLPGPAPFDVRLRDGTPVHGRWQNVPTDAGPARVAVAVPRALIERPVRAALMPLLAMLALLGLLLAVTTLVQLRLGLRPLDRLRRMLAEVRDGRRDHVALDVPTELQPVIAELNALIAANRTALVQARGHVANLAHGLKTPLATLRLDLAGHDPAGTLIAQVDRIERQVRHHLGRARAASTGDLATPAIPLAPVVADLSQVLARIHADRGVEMAGDIPADFAIRCDRQDLEELLGNLLDNAWRHARARIAVTATPDGRDVAVTIADDGPGIPADRIADALAPGRRLDEQGSGHGFGIPIARELIELHGGTLTLGSGIGEGLAVVIRLPRGPAAA